MKKLLTAVIAVTAALSLCACSITGGSSGKYYDEDQTAETFDLPSVSEKDHDISLITNNKGLDDEDNLKVWKSIIAYGDSNCKRYKQYSIGKDGDVLEIMKNAADHKSKVVVLQDSAYKEALFGVQDMYPETNFITTSSGNDLFDENVHCISFCEEQAGYLAGYLAVLNGNISMGFISDGENDSNMRYLYGMVQGADDATAQLRLHDVSIKYRFIKDNEKSAKSMAKKFYESGVDTILTCTENISKGTAQAAKAAKKNMICAGGVFDGTQDAALGYIEFDTVKALDIVLSKSFDSELRWTSERDDKDVSLGMDSGCLYMQPDSETWRFKNVSSKDYDDIAKKIISGEKEIISATDRQPPIAAVVYSEFEYYSEDH